jgi:hypothetical protein
MTNIQKILSIKHTNNKPVRESRSMLYSPKVATGKQDEGGAS